MPSDNPSRLLRTGPKITSSNRKPGMDESLEMQNSEIPAGKPKLQK